MLNLDNLMSGLIGSLIGALASVIILILTNNHQRRLNQAELHQQKVGLEAQLVAERGANREQRELEQVSELALAIQDYLWNNCTLDELRLRISSHCALLTMHSTPGVREAWRDATKSLDPGRSWYETRHPLALLVDLSASTVLAVDEMPELAEWVPGPEDPPESPDTLIGSLFEQMNFRWPTPGVSKQLTGHFDVQLTERLRHMSVRLADWSDLTEHQKGQFFHHELHESHVVATTVVSAINWALGDVRRDLVGHVVEPAAVAKRLHDLATVAPARRWDEEQLDTLNWFPELFDLVGAIAVPPASGPLGRIRLVPIESAVHPDPDRFAYVEFSDDMTMSGFDVWDAYLKDDHKEAFIPPGEMPGLGADEIEVNPRN